MRVYARAVRFFRLRALKLRVSYDRIFQGTGLYEYRQLSDDESLDFLLKNRNIGIVRFGNSELTYAAGGLKDNQKQNASLRRKLVHILKAHHEMKSYAVGLPLDATIMSHASSRKVTQSIWKGTPKDVVQLYAKKDYVYLSPFLFRLRDVVTADMQQYINKLRALFADRDIIYVGPKSGRNSDIWDGIQPKRIIYVPESNAYDLFDQIKEEVKQEAIQFDCPLVLIVAGITATALSAELNEFGLPTYDLGQLSRHEKSVSGSAANSS